MLVDNPVHFLIFLELAKQELVMREDRLNSALNQERLIKNKLVRKKLDSIKSLLECVEEQKQNYLLLSQETIEPNAYLKRLRFFLKEYAKSYSHSQLKKFLTEAKDVFQAKDAKKIEQINSEKCGDTSSIYGEGFVYILRNKAMPGLLKIGLTKDIDTRLKQLFTTAVPVPFEVVHKVSVSSMFLVEQKTHEDFETFRFVANREFFKICEADAIEQLNLNALWMNKIFSYLRHTDG